MIALVTGCAGFIGRHFVRELRSRGWDVVGVDVRPIDLAKYRAPDDPSGNFSWMMDDFLEVPFVNFQPQKFDLVIHAASQAPHRLAIDSQPTTHIYNRMLDATMFNWAIRTGQKRVLYLSSCAAMDKYPDAYGLVKLSGESMAEQARDAGLAVTVVRPFSGYGEDQGTDWPFGAFLAKAMARQDPFEIWGDGSQVRDWIHVDDVVKGALATVDAEDDGLIALCTGVGTSMYNLARMICTEVGYKPDFKLRLDKPNGVLYRLGNPKEMKRYHQPTIDIAEGVKRAVKAYAG